MWTSLPQFYNSTEWRKFRLDLIAERMVDGVVYCEYSGNPIYQNYDIVLHHKTPLTMANVNDYSISLNPANIMIVSQRSHNEIHSRFGYCTQRKVYLVYGSPCSGKTSFVNRVKGNSDLVVDMDNIWECISGGNRYDKPPALRLNAFKVRDCLYDMIKTRTGKWERAFVIAGVPHKSERERLLESLGAEPIFIDVDKETSMQRLASDPNRTEEQKREWTQYIEEWYSSFQT